MKALITGGAGFISHHLTRLFLDNDIDIVWLDNLDSQVHGLNYHSQASIPSQVSFLVGDVCKRDVWIDAIKDVDCIVHFAALTGTGQSMYQIARYSDVNIGGTSMMWDVLTNTSHSVKNVLVASSRSIYGEGAYSCSGSCGLVVPISRQHDQLRQQRWEVFCPNCGLECHPVATSEETRPQPASLYACSKLAQEQLSLTMGQALGIPTLVMRFQNVYGPAQSLQNPYTGIISIFSNQMRQDIPINIYEDGQESRDFIFVEDVAAICFQMILRNDQTQLLNVGSGLPTSVLDLAYKLRLLWQSNSSIEITGNYRIGDIRHNWADLTLLHSLLPDWQPITIDEGLQKFVEWAKTQDIYEDQSQTAYQELKQRNL